MRGCGGPPFSDGRAGLGPLLVCSGSTCFSPPQSSWLRSHRQQSVREHSLFLQRLFHLLSFQTADSLTCFYFRRPMFDIEEYRGVSRGLERACNADQ